MTWAEMVTEPAIFQPRWGSWYLAGPMCIPEFSTYHARHGRPQLATDLHLSPFYFSCQFHNISGRGPSSLSKPSLLIGHF